MIIGKKKYDDAIEEFDQNAETGGGAYKEYMAFSKFIHGVFIKDQSIDINRQNFREVNRELMTFIKKNVERHPKMFAKFFMVE